MAFNVYYDNDFETADIPQDRHELLEGVTALTMEFREPQWLMEGLIAQPSVNMLVGEGGTNKSLWCQNLMISLATGSPFLHHFAATRPANVLYVQTESGKRGFIERLQKIARGLGIEPEAVRNRLHLLTNTTFQLDNERDLYWLAKHVLEPKAIDLVVFDPLRDLHSKNENSSEEMKPIADAFRWYRDRFHTSTLVVHHTNKGADYSTGSDRSRGTTALWNWMDGRMYLSLNKGWSRMSEVYLKEHGSQQSFRFRPIFTGDRLEMAFNLLDEGGKPVDVEKARDKLRSHDEYLIFEAFAKRRTATYAQLMEDTSRGRTTVVEAIQEFERLGWAKTVSGSDSGGRGNAKVFEMTEMGQRAA